MSESKVPLPEPQREDCVAWYLEAKGSKPEPSDALVAFARLVIGNLAQAYGDARAAEARRLALLEAADLAAQTMNDSEYLVDPDEFIADRLRALADEPQPNRTAMSSADSR